MSKAIAESILDETCEQFHADGDVIDALDMWVREHLSDQEILNRLKFLKDQAEERASNKINCPADRDADEGDSRYSQERDENGPWEAA